jgi:cell division protein FtsB
MKKFGLKIEIKQFAVIGLLGVFAFLMMDLNSRLWDLSRISSERDQVATQVYEQLSTQAFLQTRIAYSKSNSAVEDYARNDAHLAKPGDNVVFPQAQPNLTITPPVIPTPVSGQFENWQVWWALFFNR